jgi:hypothetical protein
MSVKSFKFVSPGVFINEIDNSFIPKTADAIGPVVIGRARRGLAMTPVKVKSYSDFVTQFGETVAGGAGGDIYRNGNYQSPMYGTYAAKAFLRSNVAPVTFIRLLGQNTTEGAATGTDASAAGWKTLRGPSNRELANGGAFGLFLFRSGSSKDIGKGTHAATFYLNSNTKGAIFLSGAVPQMNNASACGAKGVGVVIQSDTNGLFNLYVSGTKNEETISFGFDDTQETFIRKRFNTNPQLTGESARSFFPEAAQKDYWLGESYEQALRRSGLHSNAVPKFGVLLPLGAPNPVTLTADRDTDPSYLLKQPSREAVAGWFIGQDLGSPGAFVGEQMQKLFRLKGRGHGEWLHKNCKVSIEKIRQSTSTESPYGTFSVVIRDINDTDNRVVVLERFDNCTLNPRAPSYLGRKIGTEYKKWDSVSRRLKTYGDYPNNSNFIYVEMNDDVEAGSTASPTLLPFGYYGPPKPADVTAVNSTGSVILETSFILTATGSRVPGTFLSGTNNDTPTSNPGGTVVFFSGNVANDETDSVSRCPNDPFLCALTGNLAFPSSSIRVSASDGGLRDLTNAYFGFSSTRDKDSTRPDASVADFHRLPYSGYADDPTSQAFKTSGIQGWSYLFTMDNITFSGSAYYHLSGSRKGGVSATSWSVHRLAECWV